jgi:hypothetical protein
VIRLAQDHSFSQDTRAHVVIRLFYFPVLPGLHDGTVAFGKHLYLLPKFLITNFPERLLKGCCCYTKISKHTEILNLLQTYLRTHASIKLTLIRYILPYNCHSRILLQKRHSCAFYSPDTRNTLYVSRRVYPKVSGLSR